MNAAASIPAIHAPVLADLFTQVRALSVALTDPLSDADATVQAMDDASPAKWHLAHTSWFFETFILRDHVPGYQPFDPNYHFLFNSYYEAEGARHARPMRGMLTRPSLDDIRAYRAHVDAAMLQAMPTLSNEVLALVELGLNHEQQHQELLLTDILYLFAQNPLNPAIWPPAPIASTHALPIEWIEGPVGRVEIGHDGAGFAFDCEGPRHPVWLTPYALANRAVTNGEWAAFIADGGYSQSRHWLSDGWAWVQANGIEAPLYWRKDQDGGWQQFGLDGLRSVDPAAPVCHISLYEADAYAAWAGARLPTEAEWEAIAALHDSASGNQLDRAGPVRPRADAAASVYGNVWQWTGSAYRPYPGFKAAEGAVGEYNGKFMSGQFVLRGASCATPRGSVRPSYRNFFYPHQRWQFTGLRLAKDLS
ncbi:ergothioneine biosynthesis protein EgtB [Sphingomonas sp. 35-24ZXX]|uniref:ergothioneine biosynthesis protein EgtB n=1 Tax=Sphingomonas sp. 35-24ZXX TaxID=1545915 RepID=UPI0006909781|nr:ergothioneine biosynthesis protein EgtB [Sphingomonas sp. 35-24ZXX]